MTWLLGEEMHTSKMAAWPAPAVFRLRREFSGHDHLSKPFPDSSCAECATLRPDDRMIFGDAPVLAPTSDSTLIGFIRPEVRDAVIFFRPCPATIRGLVESAPAPGELALLCAHNSLAELRELIRQTEFEAGPQSIVFFHGGITQSLRVF